MTETAQTLIKAALRQINAIATGETPTAPEMEDGLEALKIMLRSWSSDNLMIYFIEQDTLTLTGASSYTVGSGGDLNVSWPTAIKGAVRDSEQVVRIVGEERYRRINTSNSSGDCRYLYYNPEYPLGLLYPYPTGGSSIVIDFLKALTDPTGLTDTVQFPTSYDAAIKFNLALELAPEYGRDPSLLVIKRAAETKKVIQSKNFANQINAATIELISGSGTYRIDEG